MNQKLRRMKRVASSAIGIVSFRVVKALIIEPQSPLTFSAATAGTEAATVLPTDQQSAKFIVKGEAHTAYQVSLPKQIQLNLDGSADAHKNVVVSNFTSYPGSTGQLNADGEQVISVGATRSALLNNQEVGTYQGSFTIEVIY